MGEKAEIIIGDHLLIPCSRMSTLSNKTGSWRFLRPRYDEKTAPCSAACPAGEDIAMVEMLTTQGSFKEAWDTILRENPFPAVCGRVCFHPCEGRCNRGEFDEAIAIHGIERFLADTAARNEFKSSLEKRPPRKEKIAIVGAGPSGLAAAYFLTMLGYACDVFEAMPEAGGVLRWGIPEYRLPVSVLRSEIARIEAMGVRIYTGKAVSSDFLSKAQDEYHAVFMGCGHSRSRKLAIPGEDLEGLEEGISFLNAIRRGETASVHETVAVIGGGNTAVDVARSIVRLGGKAIIVYRRRREDMPAFDDEITMALEEGVEIRELLAPVRIDGTGESYTLTVRAMRVAGTDSDGRAAIEPAGEESEEIVVQKIFKAIGEEAAEEWYRPGERGGQQLTLSNSILVRQPDGVVVAYGGDLTNDVKSVVHAVASGKEAAMALDILFRKGLDAIKTELSAYVVGSGPSLSMEIYMAGPRCERNHHVVAYNEINIDYFHLSPRITQPRLLIDERKKTFGEIDLKISANLAIRETERCFNCGLCNQCDNCYLFCPDIAVCHDESKQGRHINYDYCKGCGLCVVECPRNAMILEEEGQ
ncbi:MAG: FAD-dependent oxidoreductase [Deltaproteobacteria bacterium]|nr:FAD-dependent oxidoreductase [Deltaproteobacteria bacterium]MBN2688665.1 FAD-dependent oxidoreductase [Deltaproteobacteria bacterium]